MNWYELCSYVINFIISGFRNIIPSSKCCAWQLQFLPCSNSKGNSQSRNTSDTQLYKVQIGEMLSAVKGLNEKNINVISHERQQQCSPRVVCRRLWSEECEANTHERATEIHKVKCVKCVLQGAQAQLSMPHHQLPKQP